MSGIVVPLKVKDECAGTAAILSSTRTLACHGEDANLRVCLEIRRQALGNVVLEHVRLQIGCSMLLAVKTVKHLYILVTHQQRLGQRPLNRVEEWLTVIEIHLGRTWAVALFNLHGYLKISIYFFHVLLLFSEYVCVALTIAKL